jgi:hypothetical protein
MRSSVSSLNGSAVRRDRLQAAPGAVVREAHAVGMVEHVADAVGPAPLVVAGRAVDSEPLQPSNQATQGREQATTAAHA